MQDSAIAVVRLDSPFRAVACVVGGLFVFSLQDVVVKSMSGDYPVHQLVFVRSIVALLPLILLVWWEGGPRTLRTKRPWFHALRGAAAFLAYTGFYLALAAMPLAETVAIFFVAPLFVTALAVPLLGEQVGRRRWMAVCVGFIGVLIMTRPGAAVFEPAALLAVFAALAYAASIVMTRRLGISESGAAMAFYGQLTYLPLSAVIGLTMGGGIAVESQHPSIQFLTRAWVLPNINDFGLMAFCGLVAGVGFYLLSQAYRMAPANVVAPFEYMALPWAMVLGFVVWGDVPQAASVAGICLVVGSGLYILRRERVRGRRPLADRGLRSRV